VTTAPDRSPRAVQRPLEVDAVPVIAFGTAVWFVIFVVLLVFHGRVVDAGHETWLWTSLAGTGLGLIGLPMCMGQRAAVRRSSTPAPPAADPPDPAPADPAP
jgi:hypothetical protein